MACDFTKSSFQHHELPRNEQPGCYNVWGRDCTDMALKEAVARYNQCFWSLTVESNRNCYEVPQFCGSTISVESALSPGKAYPPEFYYDTYSPLWQNRPRVYGFKLQWTQMNPNAVDRIVAYRLGIRQVGWLRPGPHVHGYFWKQSLSIIHYFHPY